MNSRSINRLKRKFILIAMSSFLIVMLFTGSTINFANALSTRSTLRTTLNYIIENDGEMPTNEDLYESDSTAEESDDDLADGRRTGSNNVTPEFQYSTRYFAVIMDDEGEVIDVNLKYISAISEETALTYVDNVRNDLFRHYFTFGNYGDFYYKWGTTSDGNSIIVFLDSSTLVTINERVIGSTILICVIGMMITFLVVCLFSSKLVQPEIENARRQKQFITNASHELKTPLAVIRANTEIEEMMHGESEWTQSTMRQVDRLNSLIQNLVMITKAEEEEDRSILSEINVGKAVAESVDPYESLAIQEHKTLVREIPEDVTLVADASKIQQLTTLLVDNAFKYCDDEGTIVVNLQSMKKGKSIQLTVSNHYAEGATVDYDKFFDRFYRKDDSRNQDEGGYGIGLSIAESICASYKGSIHATWKDGIISFICVLK